MGCFVKGAVRFGVMAALAGGAAAVVAEAARPGSVGAILHQTSGMVGSVIDANIDDPAAMRAQIKRLQAEYPEKIAEVRARLGVSRGPLGARELWGVGGRAHYASGQWTSTAFEPNHVGRGSLDLGVQAGVVPLSLILQWRSELPAEGVGGEWGGGRGPGGGEGVEEGVPGR